MDFLRKTTNKLLQEITILNVRAKIYILLIFTVVVQSQVVSDSLPPHEHQAFLSFTVLPCPSLSPGACSNSCPLSQ